VRVAGRRGTLAFVRTNTAKLIDVGLAHLGRFAFFTRDNPFLSSKAAIDLRPNERGAIGDILERAVSPSEWLASPGGRRLQEGIHIGCVPRDVQLVSPKGEPAVGVESVHAFLHAPLPWWLVSILWTIVVGRRLDGLLGEQVMGYRLAPGFVQRPADHTLMFGSDQVSYTTWKRFPSVQARECPGETLAASTLDIRDFYYSITALPSEIVDRFTSAGADRVKMPPAAGPLTDLLDVLHIQFGQRFRASEPRGRVEGQLLPLPVGAPSSRVLANLIMSLVAQDVMDKPDIIGAATYADDVVLVSRMLPDVDEAPRDYFRRLDILDSNESRLLTPSLAELASLQVGLDKSSTVFVRGEVRDRDEEPSVHADEPLDPYIEGDPSPEWGGGLRTVLRAPYKRERVPRHLVREIRRLVDEIRIGLDPAEAQSRVRGIIDDLDSAVFLAVRPYWTDLLVAAIAALGAGAVPVVTQQFDQLARSIEPPPGATSQTVGALRLGLRASWIHALAQALSVGLGRAERDALQVEVPELISGGPIGDLRSEVVAAYAQRLRARRLVDPGFVAAPLAEFTDWDGPLIGDTAVADFVAWAATQEPKRRRERLKRHLAHAVRFIPLHQACLAVHMWASPLDEAWLRRAFELMSWQPLIAEDALDDLHTEARQALEPGVDEVAEREEDRAKLVLRIALPSMTVSEDQLEVLIEGDRAARGHIAKEARSATMHVVLTAIKLKADLVVLPEWSVLPELVPWLMERAADSQTLVVAGQAPMVRAGTYSNMVWVGIPLRDRDERRACLVPPPREKSYLSPHEQSPLREAGLDWARDGKPVPTYRWRGFTFASLLCFEFADIATRQFLRKSADLVTVSSLNRDWRYFDAIQEATTRDNYCLTVCVNTGAYPGTRIMRPTTSATALAASVHGSEDATIVTRVIDLTPIVSARVSGAHPMDVPFAQEPMDDASLADYKAMPPT
jgi:hypothetical protein